MIKHKSGIENRATEAFSRRVALLLAVSIEVVGFEKLKEDYEDCPDFDAVVASLGKELSWEYNEYTFPHSYLFKNNKLCIPRTSVRNFLV